MIVLGFCKLGGTHGGAAAYRDPARRAAATGATPVAGATHGRGCAGTGAAPAVGAATHEDRRAYPNEWEAEGAATKEDRRAYRIKF